MLLLLRSLKIPHAMQMRATGRNTSAMTVLFAVLVACFILAPQPCRGQQAKALPTLNIDIHETSISGLSSGANLAVQFQVVHSSIIKGVGVIAGGPYFCSRNNLVTAGTLCSCTLVDAGLPCKVTPTSTDVASLVRATRGFAAKNLIEPINNLAKQRVFLFTGKNDQKVPSEVMAQLTDYYERLSIPEGNISAIRDEKAGHTMPTVAYGEACEISETPFIGKCGFDAAKEILSWIYGPLRALRNGRLTGRFVKFDQTPYLPANIFTWFSGLDTTGWVYMPAACAQGAACRLHVALHGCQQGQDYIPENSPPGGKLYYGTTFVRHAGYHQWADTNNIVVLYPQVVSIPYMNPKGCWDWWGYTGDDYMTKNGVQISAIYAMVNQITSGGQR
jgi:hypothetical protein